jgi:FAD/FMN-containing dehydrogenase
VDYLDGVVLARDRVVLSLARGVPEAPYASDYTGRAVYWRSLADRSEDYLTIHDYLWRWDTDWFWCSRAFGVQNPAVRPLVPRSMKRSEVYWSAMNSLRRSQVIARADELRRRRREFVIQDVEVPLDQLGRFLAFFDDEVGMLPIWLCPIRQRDPSTRWSTFALEPEVTYVNVGFWGSVYVPPGTGSGWVNQRIEHEVSSCGGHKSLYSDSFYDRDQFERLYGGVEYAALKQQYDNDGRLQDLFSKCVTNH